MLRMTWSREEPSTRAASSVSRGIPSMKPLIIQIANGVTIERFTRMSPMRVSRIPRSRKRRKKGSTITTAGTNWVARIITNRTRSPRIRKREKE